MVWFNLEATGTGTATVTVTANGNGHKAGETISIGVRAPNPPVISVTRAMIGKDATKHFGFSPFKADDNQWATLELTGFPSVDCGGIFSFLTNCTYNCTEQISSKGISLLAIRNMLPEDRQKQIDKMIPELLQQLYQRQLGNGGFVYWPGSADASGWVSSMAGQFMISASQNGFSVSKGVLASWSRFQKRNVQDYRNSDNEGLGDLVQATGSTLWRLTGRRKAGP